ncbi:glutathione S-transferase [Altererythrobacter soli]|uniref:Glutathione S-transferase n=1 Tax=Croceibacterium soli TaxID=1739690 RepID=A0A6I4UXL8_9SPHN|nr:glutathione S-transferase N-terminal domain-containing protein [Croceibacterium soli]MXP42684.1 glutathione S-transferase [Croceibacterium soli]
MAEYTFFFNPMSRAQIARWALHEAHADYQPVFVDWDNKPQALLDANPLGKLPTVIHHHGGHDHAVSEAAAVCHYLAEMSAPELLPRQEEKADYFRWLFFAAGPLEAAVTAKAFGFDSGDDRKKQITVGWGSYDKVVDALESWFAGRDYVCGSRFTMADVYVGSHVDWGMQFGTIPARDSLSAYAERVRQREAYQAGKAIDGALIAEMQAAQPA